MDVGKQYRISAWHNFVFCCRSVRSAGSAGSVAAPLIETPLTLTQHFFDISTDRRLCQAAEGVMGFEVMTAVQLSTRHMMPCRLVFPSRRFEIS